VDGKKHGLGVFYWHKGDIHFGYFYEDQLEGFGIHYFPYGGHAFGQFSQNKIHGKALIEFPNGIIYNGGWKNGK